MAFDHFIDVSRFVDTFEFLKVTTKDGPDIELAGYPAIIYTALEIGRISNIWKARYSSVYPDTGFLVNNPVKYHAGFTPERHGTYIRW